MPKAFSLTDKDREVHAYLLEQIHDNGYAPTVRELCVHFGIQSPSTMQTRLERLIRHGLIERVGARALRVHDA